MERAPPQRSEDVTKPLDCDLSRQQDARREEDGPVSLCRRGQRRCVTAGGRAGGGCGGTAGGAAARAGALRARGSGPSCPAPTARLPCDLSRLRCGASRSLIASPGVILTAAHLHESGQGRDDLARRRRALETVEKVVTTPTTLVVNGVIFAVLPGQAPRDRASALAGARQRVFTSST